MSNPLLPFQFLLRALREDARSKTSYALRTLVVAWLLSLFLILSLGLRNNSAPGLSCFSALAYTQLFLLTFCGAVYFGGSITEEKEGHTAGLLLLTGAGPGMILLGKGISRLASIILVILATAPTTFLTLSLGGVDLRQVTSFLALLVAYTGFLFGLAIAISTLSSRTIRAVSLVLISLLILYCGLPILSNLLQSFPAPNGLSGFIPFARDFNPFARLGHILDPRGQPDVWSAGQSAMLIAGAIGFLIATLFFNQKTESISAEAPPSEKLLSAYAIRPHRDAARHKEQLLLPMGRKMRMYKMQLYLLLFVLANVLYFMVAEESIFLVYPVAVVLCFLEGGLCAYFSFGMERQEQTVTNMMTLPYPARGIVKGKLKIIKSRMLPNLVFLFFALILAGIESPEMVFMGLLTIPLGIFFFNFYIRRVALDSLSHGWASIFTGLMVTTLMGLAEIVIAGVSAITMILAPIVFLALNFYVFGELNKRMENRIAQRMIALGSGTT